jgi:hypothetical protein
VLKETAMIISADLSIIKIYQINCNTRMTVMIKLLIIVWCIGTGIIPVVADSIQSQDSVQELLFQVREKMGYSNLQNQPYGIKFLGSGKASGLKSQFSFHSLMDGEFKFSINSRLGSTKCFDGLKGWQVDYTGMSYPLEYWELEVAKLIAWVIGGYWLDPDCPLDMRLLPGKEKKSATRISARIPEGVLEFIIHINKRSFLPEKLTWQIYSDENYLKLSNYENEGAFLFPRHILLSEEGDITDIQVNSVNREQESAPILMKAPESPEDTYFMGGAPSIVESNLGPNGLLVRTTINGNVEVWFILDCGTSCNVIDRTLARDLNLEIFGKGKAIAAGGITDIEFFQAEQLNVGPLTITNPVFASGDFNYDSDSKAGNIGGIFGFDLFSRCLLAIDVPNLSVEISNPDKFVDNGIVWNEIIFCEDLPAIACSLSTGHLGVFIIDLGYSGSVLFHTEFARSNNLQASGEAKQVRLEGAGGSFTGYESHIDWIAIGHNRIQKPKVVLADSNEGASSDRVTAGTIGGEILIQFKKLVFDYPNKRIGFQY